MSPLEKAARALEARLKERGFLDYEEGARAVIASIEPDDAMVEAAKHSEEHGAYQGFLYGNRHVIRDLSKVANQEVWSLETDDYDSGYMAMMNELERIRIRAALKAALRNLAERNG